MINNKNSKFRVRMQAYDHKVLDESAKKVILVVVKAGGKVSGPVPLKTKKTVVTINRSTFVHSKHKEKLESRVHKRLIDISDVNNEVVSALLTFTLPAGVDITIESN